MQTGSSFHPVHLPSAFPFFFFLGKITKQTSRCKRGPTGRKWYSNEHRSPGVSEEIAERTAGVVGQVAKVTMQQKLLWGIDRNRRSCKLHTAGGVEERSHFKLTYRLDQGGSDPTAVTLTWSHFSRHLCEHNYGNNHNKHKIKLLCFIFLFISARYLSNSTWVNVSFVFMCVFNFADVTLQSVNQRQLIIEKDLCVIFFFFPALHFLFYIFYFFLEMLRLTSLPVSVC